LGLVYYIQYQAKRLLGRTSRKLSILCRMGRETLPQSILYCSTSDCPPTSSASLLYFCRKYNFNLLRTTTTL